MFLCDDCHAQSTCQRGFIEGLMTSRGPCERCHKTGHMLDCHGYNFSGLTDAQIDAKVAQVMAEGERIDAAERLAQEALDLGGRETTVSKEGEK
jgi:hypothetical protein